MSSNWIAAFERWREMFFTLKEKKSELFYQQHWDPKLVSLALHPEDYSIKANVTAMWPCTLIGAAQWQLIPPI